jgi:HAD superfamily hydrolase (TIGR01490 family)
MTNTKTVAIFDFDDTLVKGDSLLPFVVGIAGWPLALKALARALFKPAPGMPDRKTAIKAAWLATTLAGVPLEKVRAVAHEMKAWPKWKSEIKSALLKHKAEGATIIVATGALDLYIHALLEGLPVDVVFCTEMERVGGKLTGRLLNTNCVRKEKARRVKAWLNEHQPFTSYGYGNAPSDLPFLALTNFPKVV